MACKEDDIRTFITSMGVYVFSCFKTKPRRRPNEAPRSAFSVCVNAAGRDRLSNPESWPDSVRIADWFFRDRSNQVDDEAKRHASPTQNNLQQAGMSIGPVASATVSGVADEMDTITATYEHDVASHQRDQHRTVDQTTLYQDGEC